MAGRKKIHDQNEADMAGTQPPKNVLERYQYVVTTDRGPFWGGGPAKKNSIIDAAPDHPAIIAMLERGWIKAMQS